MSTRMYPTRTTATGIERRPTVGVERTGRRSTMTRMIDKRGTSMNLFGRHDTQGRRHHPGRRKALVFAIAVAVLALAWLSFNALIRVVTLD